MEFNRKAKGIALLSVVALTLAGCGGGSGGRAPNAFAFTDPNEVVQDAAAVLVTGAIEGRTQIDDLPSSGVATYQGIANVVVDTGARDRLEYLGTFDVQADFSTGTISGNADNFVGIAPESTNDNLIASGPVQGGLTFLPGTIDDGRGDAGFEFDAEGQLADGNVVVDIDNAVDGRFIGANGQVVTATSIDGSVVDVTTSGVTDSGDLSILLIGERQ